MASYKTAAQAAQAIAASAGVGYSKHRGARVLRYIHRHPSAHRRIIGKILKLQQKHEVHCDKRFRAMQALPASTRKLPTATLPWTRRGRRVRKAMSGRRAST